MARADAQRGLLPRSLHGGAAGAGWSGAGFRETLGGDHGGRRLLALLGGYGLDSAAVPRRSEIGPGLSPGHAVRATRVSHAAVHSRAGARLAMEPYARLEPLEESRRFRNLVPGRAHRGAVAVLQFPEFGGR